MKAETRISFVLASYNGASYIHEQLQSLLENMGDADEIIVSDDDSTDNTRLIVSSFCDHRITLLPKGQRLGYQGNFERAIFSARGRYIFFTDQDDICLPARVSQSLLSLRKYSCVAGDATVVDANLKVISNSYFCSRNIENFSAIGLFAKPAIIGATVACTREFLEGALPFPAGLPHDQWLSVLAALDGQLDVVRNPFILYRRHGSTVSTTGVPSRRGLLTILVERLQFALALWRRLARRA